MGRLFTPLIAGAFGVLVGAYLSGWLIEVMRQSLPPGPWSDAVLIGFAGLTGLLFAVLGAWLDSAVDTNQLAVTPLRHLMTLTFTAVGALVGAGFYYGLTRITGPLEPEAAKLFAGFIMGLFALMGFDKGRRTAQTAIY